MKGLILCHRLNRLRTALKNTSGQFRYINLMDNSHSLEIRAHLGRMADVEELPRAQLLRERSEGFREKYIELIGKVNEGNHSLYWWTLRLADKSHLVPDLCRDVSYFFLIADLVRSDVEPLVVITDSVDLAGQVKIWGDKEGVAVINLVGAPWTWRRIIRTYTPAGLINAFTRNFLYWLLSRQYKPAPNLADDHLVITTCTHPRSFGSDRWYSDAYFGSLVEHKTTQKHNAIIFAWVLEQPLYQLNKLKDLMFPLPVVPIESCLTLRNLMACLFRSLYLYVRPLELREPAEIDNLDLSYLVKRAMNRSRQSGDIFWGLRIYYCARELAQTVRIARCLYPYENLVREKMLLEGIRSASPETKMVGYQHASISRGHTNFIFREGEANITPIPEMILTSGSVTKEWLEKEGNYPPGIFKTACGLRQGRPSSAVHRKRANRIDRVLVVFGSLEEYVNALAFVEKSFTGEREFEVTIRPHPTTPLDAALKIAPLTRIDFFSTNTGTLADALLWADVVLYASSTVGLEALLSGIPVIYMDLGDFLDADPMFGWNEFKWPVADPTEMVNTICEIESISDARFQELQEKGRQYASAYLHPVTESAVRMFLEV